MGLWQKSQPELDKVWSLSYKVKKSRLEHFLFLSWIQKTKHGSVKYGQQNWFQVLKKYVLKDNGFTSWWAS